MKLAEVIEKYKDEIGNKKLILKDNDGHYVCLFEGEDGQIVLQMQEGLGLVVHPEPTFEFVELGLNHPYNPIIQKYMYPEFF